MANVLSNYDPIFYANEALIQLRKNLGLAARVHRGYDPTPQQRGSTINIPRPTSFTATEVNPTTGGTTQDIDAGNVSLVLDTWKEVKFALSDKELAYTKERIIEDHIGPAAYALADAIDQSIANVIKLFPWYKAISATAPTVGDITAAKAVLSNLRVPMLDGNVHFMIDPTLEAQLTALSAFATQSGSGQAGVDTQLRGYLGTRYGMEFFMNQNVPSVTSGTAADTSGAVNANTAKGATEIVCKSFTQGETIKVGDILAITGDDQQYVVTEDVTVGASTTTIKIFPALAKAAVADAVVTLKQPSGSGGTKAQNFLFHRNAIALGMGVLSEIGNNIGARIATVTDPVTGLTLRSRMWYDGDHSLVKVSLDALWGVKVLDPNMGVRVVQTAS